MDLMELLDRTGLDVLDHLERQVAIPVIDGLQAQGDLIVIPMAMLGPVTVQPWAQWRLVPSEGVELVRGVAGNNPHTLVADAGVCRWTNGVRDPLRLGIALFENTAPAYLVHPEHGGSGVAPGRWLVRRQQERGTGPRGGRVLVAD
ncbi:MULTISPECIES: hypothetical protein [Actinoalloteichus]|uniref:Uncharacterized protein n=1 Tax=Actinoalloteichus fjordicus TaxID=1612552 RepID=A0AAC9PST6_9PSEU|nr:MULTISPECIES: hypothetical protein [Actinoalloteichus]APU15904.1 hypothetical protein UA74_19395 [Actinoalloteichus fjordicus]APU21966.1 hypothetical protein UA75_19885 [Actinoalloteichus sp. GBA129-24]